MGIVIGIISAAIAFVIGWTVEMKAKPLIKEGLEDMVNTAKELVPKKKR